LKVLKHIKTTHEILQARLKRSSPPNTPRDRIIKLHYEVENYKAIGEIISISLTPNSDIINTTFIPKPPREKYRTLVGTKKVDLTNRDEINPGEKIAKQKMSIGFDLLINYS
jgi:hypothetical protein